MAGAQRDLAESLGDTDLDRVGRNQIEPLGAVLVSQEIEQMGSQLGRIHAGPPERLPDLLGRARRVVGFGDAANAANQVEHRQIRDRASVGEAAALEVGGLLGAHALAELVEQAGLPDPGVPDDADELASATEGGKQPAV